MSAMRLYVVVVGLAIASSARADVFVMPPPVYEGTDGEIVSERIVAAIQKDLGAESTVITPDKSVGFLSPTERTWCASGECIERYRAASNATAAVVVRVYRLAVGEGPATSFQVGLQPSPGLEYRDGIVIDPEVPLERQAQQVVGEVLRQYRRGPGPHLSVTGAPAGAVVFVDDEPKGPLPVFLTVPVGAHRVRVEATGFAPMTRFVWLQSATSFGELSFRLEPEARREASVASAAHRGSGLRPLTPSQRTGVGMMAIGSTLAVSSLLYLAVAVADGKGGQCLHAEGPLCLRRDESRNVALRLGVSGSVAAMGMTSAVIGSLIFKREKDRLRPGLALARNAATLSLMGTF